MAWTKAQAREMRRRFGLGEFKGKSRGLRKASRRSYKASRRRKRTRAPRAVRIGISSAKWRIL